MTELLRSAAYFPVADVEATITHYVNVLGFTCQYRGGTPPRFAILARDAETLMLRLVTAPERIVPVEKQGGTWDVFFWVSDARALHAELARNGAEIVYGPLIQQEYNMEEFAVRDPDGHVLGFGQQL